MKTKNIYAYYFEFVYRKKNEINYYYFFPRKGLLIKCYLYDNDSYEYFF